MTRTTLIPFLVLCASCSSAQPTPERLDEKVRQGFFLGLAGDDQALERSMKSSEDVLAREPRHAEALVWHGVALYYQAGQAFRRGDATAGLTLFGRGMKEMDDAVTMDPSNLAVRVPRGSALLIGTRTMQDQPVTRPLLEKGLSDYQHAYDRQKQRLSQLGLHPRGELLFGLAEGWSRLGNRERAGQLFEELKASAPGTEYESRAVLWLAGGSLPPERTGCVGCHVE